MDDLTRKYKCPNCDTINYSHHWDNSLNEYYGECDISINKDDIRDNYFFLCPTCAEEIDGHFIKEIK